MRSGNRAGLGIPKIYSDKGTHEELSSNVDTAPVPGGGYDTRCTPKIKPEKHTLVDESKPLSLTKRRAARRQQRMFYTH
jgi:hypothetical protein